MLKAYRLAREAYEHAEALRGASLTSEDRAQLAKIWILSEGDQRGVPAWVIWLAIELFLKWWFNRKLKNGV